MPADSAKHPLLLSENPVTADIESPGSQSFSLARSDTVETAETLLRLEVKTREELFLNIKIFTSSFAYCDQKLSLDVDDEMPENEIVVKKSMRSMSRSTFDSIIDDYIDNDWEKKSAFGVSLTVCIILTTFLFLLFSALSVSLGVQHGNPSRKIAFDICSKERKRELFFLISTYSVFPVSRLGISRK